MAYSSLLSLHDLHILSRIEGILSLTGDMLESEEIVLFSHIRITLYIYLSVGNKYLGME